MQPTKIENKTDLADFCGVSRNTLYKWLRIPGFPIDADGGASPYLIGRWSVLREIENEYSDEDSDGDTEDITGWKIKNLKEDHRRKTLANDATEASLIPRDKVAEQLLDFASLVRGACEQLQREYGNDAADILNDAMDEFERRLNAADSLTSTDDSE